MIYLIYHIKLRLIINIFTRKVRIITMHENIKVYREENVPFGIHFVGETLCDEKYLISRKSSDIISLEYIVEGSGTLCINGQTLHPKKNDVFLLLEGSKHKYYCDKDKPWHKYFVSFYGPVADMLIKNYLPENTYLFEDCSILRRNFERIFDYAFNNEDMAKINYGISTELFKIFNLLYTRQKTESEDLADKIKQYMENNIAEEFNLETLCRDMNYSKNHIINVFFNKFGVTPYKYYKDNKIQLAKEYLTNTKMTVGEISNALAFSDQQYFSYSFKKETGYSPKKYRDLMKV